VCPYALPSLENGVAMTTACIAQAQTLTMIFAKFNSI
jgi:hypothetical protein